MRGRKYRLTRVLAAGLAGLLCACGCGGSREFRPIDPNAALFWDRQTDENRDLLDGIIAEFNQGREGIPVKADYVGGYPEIFRKLVTSIQARTVPAMAVGYQSMTTVYAQAGAVLPLDPFIADPEIGLSEKELDDFFPVVLETNRYPTLENGMYSFPFCKSVLMLYFNKRVLAAAGLEQPPRTWDEFLAQCRQIKERTGKRAYAVAVDASTFDGMVYSMGGDVYADGKSLLDSPEALAVLKLYETLGKEGLAYQILAHRYDDRADFAQDKVAFFFRSSSHRTYTATLVEPGAWGMAVIPQADPERPQTVLYGPNINIFQTTPEQERIAWEFTKYFTSPEITVRWALGTGYLPIRKSAAQDPRMLAFWNEWTYNKAPFDCLSFARCEPNVPGWQEVREHIENALAGVLNGVQTAEEAAAELKWRADKVLEESR
ncbi:MAG TPA: ABC transporter substrate-binding protein [Candidatus Hydrogenedentes bacterium]|nr:ABC transporter substrate-binding protein [Candidatus Hydrogenedentota bacterium]HQH54533.1 ABC transporter substrate-binding protein [Candidatus Hydrogenedentota bacterium]